MTGKDYFHGFVLGLLATLLMAVDLCLLLYFAADMPAFVRVILATMPFVLNIALFSGDSYSHWFYKKAVVWLCGVPIFMLVVYLMGTLFVLQDDVLSFLMQESYEEQNLAWVKTTVQYGVFYIIAYVLGGLFSFIAVGFRKNTQQKKHEKDLNQKKQLLKRKSRMNKKV